MAYAKVKKKVKKQRRRSVETQLPEKEMRTTGSTSEENSELKPLSPDTEPVSSENDSWDKTVTRLMKKYDNLWKRLADA